MKVSETHSSIEVHISGAAEVNYDTQKFPNKLPNISEQLSVLPVQKVMPYTTCSQNQANHNRSQSGCIGSITSVK